MHRMIEQRLKDGAGLDGTTAERVASAVVCVLIEQLPTRDRAAFRSKLPEGFASPPLGPARPPCDSLAQLYGRVSALAGLPMGRAAELSQIVCAALAQALDDDGRAWLAARLPADLATLLAGREVPSRPPEAPHAPRRYRTLADGRPGSTRPLSEARFDPAHHDSIARSEHPHADTKLSSSEGPTQSREHETLAEGDPRPARRLSTSKS